MRPGSWLPPVVWMVVIAAVSTSLFGAETSGRIVHPVLAWLVPWLTPDDVELVHVVLRKLAHLTAYAILAGLWYRAFARDRIFSGRPAAAVAFALSVGWACVDEALQMLAPGRIGSVADVMIDAAGAGGALAVAAGGLGRTLDVLGTTLLWIAAAGGGGALILNATAGVPSGTLWIAAPAATLILAFRILGGGLRPPSDPSPQESIAPASRRSNGGSSTSASE